MATVLSSLLFVAAPVLRGVFHWLNCRSWLFTAEDSRGYIDSYRHKKRPSIDGRLEEIVLQRLSELCLQVILGGQTDDGFSHFAILEHQDCRDRTDRELARDVAVVVNVHLTDLNGITELVGKFFQNRRDGFTRAAPWCPEVDDDWHGCTADCGVEAAAIEFGDLIGHDVQLSWVCDY